MEKELLKLLREFEIAIDKYNRMQSSMDEGGIEFTFENFFRWLSFNKTL